MHADRSIGASTAAYVAAVWGVLLAVGFIAVIVLSGWASHVVTDDTGLTDRVARPGWQMLGASAAGGIVAVAAGAVLSATEMLTDEGASRTQACWTAVALTAAGIVATPAGVLTARALNYERSPATYLFTGGIVFMIVTAALVVARRKAEAVVMERSTRPAGLAERASR